jgi:tRNA modification GTPase
MAPADVIAAVATAGGRAAIGIVRLSGPDLTRFFPPLLGRVQLAPRHATLGPFLDAGGQTLDFGLTLYFPAPHSYTGEDVLELHGHGGDAVVRSLLARCLELGARLAQPGEFTRRAFLNDRLDLAQAEAVADLIEAGSAAAARSALRSLSGEFSKRIQALVAGLIELRALVEACIDFPDEDVQLLSERDGLGRLDRLTRELDETLRASESGCLLREGAQVVLFGRPNVGKSSLLNALSGEEVAIVTDVPGTTRDALREEIQLDGVPLHIVDTAGLRESDDVVEAMGISRTLRALERADLGLLVMDASAPFDPADLALLDRLAPGVPRMIVHNKIDLTGQNPRVERGSSWTAVWVSAKSGAGLNLLSEQLLRQIGWQPRDEGVFLARERHLVGLRAGASHLRAARDSLDRLELFAEELRLAQLALAQITGEFTADDLLGEIFSRFCIGK